MGQIKELDRVVVLEDAPGEGLIDGKFGPVDHLSAGDVGTVVHVYGRGTAFEVEFLTLTGETLALTTLRRDQVRPVTGRDAMHVRVIDPSAVVIPS